MAPVALIKELKKKGYIFVCKGKSNRMLMLNEYQAKKMVREIRAMKGYRARAIKSSQVSTIGDTPLWMVMYRIPKKR